MDTNPLADRAWLDTEMSCGSNYTIYMTAYNHIGHGHPSGAVNARYAVKTTSDLHIQLWVVGYPEERSKDFSKKKKYSRILTDDKNVDRTFSRNTKMSIGHLVENQNIDRNNIEGSKI